METNYHMESEKVTVHLETVQYSCPEIEFFADNAFRYEEENNDIDVISETYGEFIRVSEEKIQSFKSDVDGEPVRIEYFSEARLTRSGDFISLSYTEPTVDDLVGTEVSISFYDNKKSDIFIERKGAVGAGFVLWKNVLCKSFYNTPYGMLSLRALTLGVDNRVTESGGSLTLDYITQLDGCEAQRIRMRIEIGSKA